MFQVWFHLGSGLSASVKSCLKSLVVTSEVKFNPLNLVFTFKYQVFFFIGKHEQIELVHTNDCKWTLKRLIHKFVNSSLLTIHWGLGPCGWATTYLGPFSVMSHITSTGIVKDEAGLNLWSLFNRVKDLLFMTICYNQRVCLPSMDKITEWKLQCQLCQDV